MTAQAKQNSDKLQPVHAKLNPKENDGQGIQVLSRAVDILRVISTDTSGLSLGKIAIQVDLPRSTVQRIVSALMAENLICTRPNAKGYSIGPEMRVLANANSKDVRQCLHPIMEKLSVDTGETADLAMFRNDQMVFVDQVPGRHRLRTVSAIGETFPMTITANGKAALCLLNDADISRILEREKDQSTVQKSHAKLTKELIRIKADGYGLDIDEHTIGISAVGMAFRVGEAIYAISIPTPTQRFKTNKAAFIERLLAARADIADALPESQFAAN